MADNNEIPRMPPDNPGAKKKPPSRRRKPLASMPISADEASEILSGWRADCLAAGAFLTRLPFSGMVSKKAGKNALALSTRAWPLVGLGLGLVAAMVIGAASFLGLAPMAGSLLALASLSLMTGALHEDGLADTADGLVGGSDKKKRLAIMDDAQIGVFGVLALVFSLGLRVGALSSFETAGAAGAALIAACCVSRASLVAMAWQYKPAKTTGLGAQLGKPSEERLYAALALGAALALLFLGPVGGIFSLLVAASAGIAFALYMQKSIGGYTGDTMGALQQISETAVLLAAAIAF